STLRHEPPALSSNHKEPSHPNYRSVTTDHAEHRAQPPDFKSYQVRPFPFFFSRAISTVWWTKWGATVVSSSRHRRTPYCTPCPCHQHHKSPEFAASESTITGNHHECHSEKSSRAAGSCKKRIT
ncbi:unnamed protein product, partial [Ectocarpus sp. 12 AP-2014]